jgi:hypothetical protein
MCKKTLLRPAAPEAFSGALHAHFESHPVSSRNARSAHARVYPDAQVYWIGRLENKGAAAFGEHIDGKPLSVHTRPVSEPTIPPSCPGSPGPQNGAGPVAEPGR